LFMHDTSETLRCTQDKNVQIFTKSEAESRKTETESTYSLEAQRKTGSKQHFHENFFKQSALSCGVSFCLGL